MHSLKGILHKGSEIKREEYTEIRVYRTDPVEGSSERSGCWRKVGEAQAPIQSRLHNKAVGDIDKATDVRHVSPTSARREPQDLLRTSRPFHARKSSTLTPKKEGNFRIPRRVRPPEHVLRGPLPSLSLGLPAPGAVGCQTWRCLEKCPLTWRLVLSPFFPSQPTQLSPLSFNSTYRGFSSSSSSLPIAKLSLFPFPSLPLLFPTLLCSVLFSLSVCSSLLRAPKDSDYHWVRKFFLFLG
ncbi:hypothetical protein CRG98_033608 [Punica granatum]|uniref:Uncharacterized protein n=1 Tax=Punica granatum TaxID=22663 RepID=A0A2I0IPN6_PUNGR|nr:hypothetical protein CRG98_033608 [Punica granatum]